MSKAKRKCRRRIRRTPPHPHQRITDVNGACGALNCGRDHLYDLLNSHEIESYLDGRSRKIVVASLDAYVARRIEASNKRWQRARFYSVKQQRQDGKGAASPPLAHKNSAGRRRLGDLRKGDAA
jgi:excisionase family DNA binding protein